MDDAGYMAEALALARAAREDDAAKRAQRKERWQAAVGEGKAP